MLDYMMFHQLLGPERFFIWSKESEIWRVFYRTTMPGSWSAIDIEEFDKCSCVYEIHFDHSQDNEAHLFSLFVMQRCDNFKAAKVSKLAVNNMKVIILLGHKADYKNQIARLAKESNFELARLRSREDYKSDVENFTNSKIGEYFENLRKAFAPTAGIRYERNDGN